MLVTKNNSLLIANSQRIKIPEHLIQCYRGNNTETWFPSSLPMVIDIIRKIEQKFPTSIDLRHLSARLFHEYVEFSAK